MVAPNKRLTADERAAIRKKLKEDQSFLDSLRGKAPWDDDPALYDPKKTPPQNPELARRLAVAKPAYAKKFGEELPVRSEVRSYDEQYDEYQRYLKNKASGFKLAGYPTLANNPNEHPGREWFHAHAFDGPKDGKKADFLAKFGFKRPLPNDKVHYELDENWKPSADIKTAYKAVHGYEPQPYETPGIASRLLGEKSPVREYAGKLVRSVIGSVAEAAKGIGKQSSSPVEEWDKDIKKFNQSPLRQADAKIIEKEEDKSLILPKGFLRAMAMSESVMNNAAPSSKKGAAGIFQFTAGTGKNYGLVEYGKDGKIVRDDRGDVAKASAAARQYLEKLWKQYGGDVDKVVAAYNHGEGNLATLEKKYPGFWEGSQAPKDFPRETQQHVAKFRHHFKNIVGETVANTVLPKERPWLKADAPAVAQTGKGKPLGVDAAPAAPILTETKKGVQPVPARTFRTDGTDRMPGESEPQQVAESDLKRGLQSFNERQAAGPATSLYGNQPPAPNAPLPDPGELNTAMRNFEVVAEPTMPARGLASEPAETFTAGPVTQPSRSTYREQSVPSSIFTPDPSTYLRPAPDMYAGITEGVEGNPPWPGSGPLARTAQPSYVEQNPSRDVFNRYSVQQPTPREDIYAGIEGGMEGNPSWPGSGPLTRTVQPSYVEQTPSRDVFNRYAVQQPEPQAMEPFTPRSTYAERNPSRDVFSRYAVQQPVPQTVEPFTPRSTYVEQSPSRDVFSRYAVEQPVPQSAAPMVPQGRSSYQEAVVPRDIWTPRPETYYTPAPPAPPYASGNYAPVSAPMLNRWGMLAPPPSTEPVYPTEAQMATGRPPMMQNNWQDPYAGYMRSSGAPWVSSERPTSVAQGTTRFGEPVQERYSFLEPEVDWYDELINQRIIQPAQQTSEPYPEDWQDQLNRYYMDTRGIRYQPEMAPIRTSTPQPVLPEPSSEPEQYVPLRQQDVTPPPYYTPEPVVDGPEVPEPPPNWSSRVKVYGW